MLGRFRLSKSAGRQLRDQSRALHCTLCVAMRETGGRRLSLALSYEAEWLLLLGLAMRGPLPERQRNATCTGVPLLPVHRLEAPPELLTQTVHLSVWLAACMLADHRIDGDRRGAADLLGGFAIRDELDRSLAALGIDQSSPLHPDALAAKQAASSDLSSYLADERSRIGPAWAFAILSVAPSSEPSPASSAGPCRSKSTAIWCSARCAWPSVRGVRKRGLCITPTAAANMPAATIARRCRPQESSAA